MYSAHDISTMKVVYKSVEMAEGLQMEIEELAKTGMSLYSVEKDIAKHIKCQLDSTKGGIWHVIVGKNFGSYVTHDRNFFIHFCIGDLSFLVFRIG